MSYLTRILRTRSQYTALGQSTFHASALIVGAILMAGTAAQAQSVYGNANDPAMGEIAEARQVCETVVRVRPGGALFNSCVSSLEGSLQDARRDRAVMQARNDCFARGLRPGSAELNLCLLQAADSSSPNKQSAMTGASEYAGVPRSYIPNSFDAVFQREEEACARLGFDPAFAPFSNCVAKLQATQQPADLPAS
jgi:hypothetical protein